jgi:hypothetical protein
MTTSFTLARQNDVPLEFEGELLAEVTSERQGSTRWTELKLYRSNTKKYVIETIGMSKVPGDDIRRNGRVADNAHDIKRALRRRDAVAYLTHMALDLLSIAAQKDEAIAASLNERI